MRMHTLSSCGWTFQKTLSILKQKATIALLLLRLEFVTVGSSSGQCLVSWFFCIIHVRDL